MSKIQNLITDYLEYLEVDLGRSEKTLENYHRYLNKFIEWSKITSSSQINENLVHKYRVRLNRVQDKSGKSLSRRTQNYHIIALRGFLKYLSKKDIKSLAAEKLDLAKTEERQVDFLTFDEVKSLIEAAEGTTQMKLRDQAILKLFFSSGLRISELTSLNRDQINLKSG